MKRNVTSKYRSTCENCKSDFLGRRGEANRFCKNACHHEWVVNKWLKCSICMAEIGIGSSTAARLLGISAPSISVAWKKRGIIAKRPENKSWFQVARVKITTERNKQKKEWNLYHAAWIDEIRSHRNVFPDWSAIWQKEKARRHALTKPSQYQMMTQEQRSSHNKKVMERRIKMWEENPQIKDRDRMRMKLWKKQNPEKAKESTRKAARKMRSNPINRIAFNMRSRFKEIMNGVRHSPTRGKWALIGCSQEDLKRHLESGFNKRMTWDNYGTYWHVDHILPCASFDHTDPKQVAQCWHWTNLRALEAKKNIAKKDTITEPQMHLLLCLTY